MPRKPQGPKGKPPRASETSESGASDPSESEKPSQPAQNADPAQGVERPNETPHAREAPAACGDVAFNALELGEDVGDYPHLGDTAAAVCRVLADPSLINRPVVEKALAAGVSRATWYRIVADEGVMRDIEAAHRRALKHYIGPVLAALAASASDLSPKCSNDRKLFFQLVGLDQPAKEDGKKAGALGDATDADILALCAQYNIPVPAGVARRRQAAIAAQSDEARVA